MRAAPFFCAESRAAVANVSPHRACRPAVCSVSICTHEISPNKTRRLDAQGEHGWKLRKETWPWIWCASPKRRPWQARAGWARATRTRATAPPSRPCASRSTPWPSAAPSSSARARKTTRPCCTTAKRSAGAAPWPWTWPSIPSRAPACWPTDAPTPFPWWAWPRPEPCTTRAPATTCRSSWCPPPPRTSSTSRPRCPPTSPASPRRWARTWTTWWFSCSTSRATKNSSPTSAKPGRASSCTPTATWRARSWPSTRATRWT